MKDPYITELFLPIYIPDSLIKLNVPFNIMNNAIEVFNKKNKLEIMALENRIKELITAQDGLVKGSKDYYDNLKEVERLENLLKLHTKINKNKINLILTDFSKVSKIKFNIFNSDCTFDLSFSKFEINQNMIYFVYHINNKKINTILFV
jgi:hypothetical protein